MDIEGSVWVGGKDELVEESMARREEWWVTIDRRKVW